MRRPLIKLYSYGGEGIGLRAESSLLECLKLSWSPHMVVSIVGGGGKTTLMYALADQLASEGKQVIVTTSTHIGYPADRKVLEPEKLVKAVSFLEQPEVLVIGRTIKSEDGSMTKLGGLKEEELASLASLADVTLVEADGAKRMPLKAPAAHEPVIIPETKAVIACAGLDAVGKTLEEACFRIGCAEKILEKSYGGNHVGGDHRITAGDVAALLTDEAGARKGVGHRQFRIVLNKADDFDKMEKAAEIMRRVQRRGEFFCLATSFSKSS